MNDRRPRLRRANGPFRISSGVMGRWGDIVGVVDRPGDSTRDDDFSVSQASPPLIRCGYAVAQWFCAESFSIQEQ